MGVSVFGFFRVCGLSAVVLLVSCGSEGPREEEEKTDTGDPAGQPDSAVRTGASTSELEAGFRDRYGPESGVVTYEVSSGETTTGRTLYFAAHGRREANYLDLGAGEHPSRHITIVDSGRISAKGPGDPEPLRTTWRPDPNQVLPNFRHLTDRMRELFQLEELPSKEILGRECEGYRLKIGKSVSDVWVWEGIMLYGEIKGGPGQDIPPMTIRAVGVDTAATPPEEVFHLE